MSTQLTVPTQKPIIPKPTKTEIISAMVEIARGKFHAEQKQAKVKLEEFDAALQKHARKLIRKHITTAKVSVVPHYHGDTIDIDFDAIPHEMGARNLYAERGAIRLKTQESFDEKSTRDDIRDRMNYGPGSKEARVDAMLCDPDARKHLEKALEALYAEDEPEAIEV